MEHPLSPDLAILMPGICLIIYTLLFYIYLGWKRRQAVLAGQIKLRYFELFSGQELPPRLVLLGRHAANLLEMPLVFYALLVFLYLSDHVTALTLSLAWGFVALRGVHALIHLTINKVLYRFQVFAVSVLLLLVMSVDLTIHLAKQAY